MLAHANEEEEYTAYGTTKEYICNLWESDCHWHNDISYMHNLLDS